MLLVELNPTPAHEPDPTLTRIELPSARRPGQVLRVDYRTDARCAFVRLRAGWLYVATPVGLESFPELTRLVAQAPARGLATTLAALDGLRLLAFVAYDQSAEALHFGRTLDNFSALYFAHDDQRLIIADSALDVAQRRGPVRFSDADEAAYCKTWSPATEGSFLEGVRRTHAGVHYRATLDGATLERRLMAPGGDPLGQAAAVDLLRDEMRRLCATYGNQRIALRLSGGVDSRVVLAGLMDAVREGILRRDQIVLTSVLFPGFDCDESALIGEIARVSGFEWIGIEATPARVAESFEQTLRFEMPPFPTAFMGMLCMSAAGVRGAQIALSGHGGDEILDYDLADVLDRPLSARLRCLGLVRSLRRTSGIADEARALAVTCLGRRGMRGLRRELRQLGAEGWLHAHRLGRRLAGAPGCGYETMAVAAARQNLNTDAPLFRAGLIARLDPVGYRHVDGNYKAVARAYMAAVAPEIARVPTSKVVFDAAVNALLPSALQARDQIDSFSTNAYGRHEVYRAWRAQFNQTRGLA